MQATKFEASLVAATLNSAVRDMKLTNLHNCSCNVRKKNLLFAQMGSRLTLGTSHGAGSASSVGDV